MEKHVCYNCMREITEQLCPHCGAISVENEPHQLPVGTVLRGQFLLGRVLGQGGYGITYLARDLHLGEVVAVKEFFPGGVVQRPDGNTRTVAAKTENQEGYFAAGKERFLREARALTQFRENPQIVQVQGYFEENNTAYIVMEYVHGPDLRTYLERKGSPMTLDEALALLLPVAAAMDEIHGKNIIHRDISPDNIILDPRTGAKLLDFGAARYVEAPETDKALSRSTEAILKHGFAPMEQYRSRGSLGPWTDQYAFCATLYYCLTGQVPPDAPSRMADDAQPDWSKAADLKPWQKAALERGLSIAPADRYPDMASLLQALREEPKQEPGLKTKPKTKKRWPILAAAAALAALLAVAVFARPGSREELPADTVPAENQAAATETTLPPEPWEENVLMFDPLTKLGIARTEVRSVTFLDTLVQAPVDAVDLTGSGAGKVLGWTEGGDVSIAADQGINARDCCPWLFSDCTRLRSVDFGTAFHTDQATSMAGMFYGCVNLWDVDVSSFQTGNVTDMSSMFCCVENREQMTEYGVYYTPVFGGALESLDVGGWDVSAVQNMRDMFAGCNRLTQLDVSAWDTGSVTDMAQMFMCCTDLKTLDVGSWDTSGVTDMSYMFATYELHYGQSLMDEIVYYEGAYGPEELDVSSWNTSSVVSMNGMFMGCSNLKKLDVAAWDVSSVINMDYMFWACTRLEELDVSRWNVSSVGFDETYEYFDDNGERQTETNPRGMVSMFEDCYALKQLDVSGWDVSNVRSISCMFSGCKSLTHLDVSRWDVSNVIVMNGLFSSCESLESINLDNWDVSGVGLREEYRDMYGNEKVEYMGVDGMFSDCYSLRDFSARGWDLSGVDTLSTMFQLCESLETLDLSSWKVSGMKDLSLMFNGCHNLSSLNISGWDVTGVENMEYMFNSCNNLTTLDMSGWDTSSVIYHEQFMEEGQLLNGRPWESYFIH